MAHSPPLVVDLDGTLLSSDLLIETAFLFIKHNPLQFFMLFVWLLRGRAYLKAKIAEHVDINAKTLPFNQTLLAKIKRDFDAGRHIALATASNIKYAVQISEFLGCFNEVFASDADDNLESGRKAALLRETYGYGQFDYVGNSKADIKVWLTARQSIVVNPDYGVLSKLKRLRVVDEVIETRDKRLKTFVSAFRLHQWLKNLLIFVPLAAGHQLTEPGTLLKASIAFLIFGICASSVYLLNDLLDLEDDRHHPRKRERAFASGALDVRWGLVLVPTLFAVAFTAALLLLPFSFAITLFTYYFITVCYSFLLKRVELVDVITLALLYTVRIIAGAFAIGSELTFWILAFSLFIFLSLALVKRCAEVYNGNDKPDQKTRGRSYYVGDKGMLSSMGASSGLLSVLVLALYINDQTTAEMYQYPFMIWLACPLLLYWIGRVWLLTHRGEMHDDPIVFAVKDRPSQIVGILMILIFMGAI